MQTSLPSESANFCSLYGSSDHSIPGDSIFFKKSTWNWFDKDFVSKFGGKSGYLMFRGVFEMMQYFCTPMLVGNLSGSQLAGYSIFVVFFLIPVLLSDSIGHACNVKGSEYLARGENAKFRRLTLYVPLVSLAIGVLLAIGFWFGRDAIIDSYTTDPRVISVVKDAFPFFTFTVFVGVFPGTFEGLCLARREYALMFMTMFIAISTWGTLSAINYFKFKYLELIWGALLAFMWCRFLPLFIVLVVDTWREWNTPDPIKEPDDLSVLIQNINS